MKQQKLIVVFLGSFVSLYSHLYAQILTANRLGVGFNVGLQKIYCESPSGLGFGMEAYARYSINPRFWASLAFGYGQLSDGTLFFDKSSYHTNLITLDLKAGLNLITEGNYIPHIYIGAGGFLFQFYDHKTNKKMGPGSILGHWGDASFIMGGGLEARINPTVALNFFMDYRFTTGDELNGHDNNQGAKDGYLNIRAGTTYYLARSPFGTRSSEVKMTDKTPIDEIDQEGTGASPDNELDALIEGLDGYDNATNANLAMEEYIKLKSRVDQLNDAIRQKELEIEELKAQLVIRKDKIADLEKNLRTRSGALAASLNVDLSDFANSYEQALQNYYSKEYDAAAYLFNMLLETSPTHRLVSNCQYWLGECYFGQGDFSTSLAAFQKVLSYEESFKKDDALLMMGRCYINLGDKQTALSMFDQLMNEFPDSEYYQRAQQYANGL